MLKFLTIVMLLGALIPSFSEEVDLSEFDYVESGHLNVLARDYMAALDAYQQIASYLERLENSFPLVEFSISYGRAVVYDNLGQKRQCERAIGALFLSAFKAQEYTDEELENMPIELSFIDKNQLQQLALIAPTLAVRELLLSLLDVDEEDSKYTASKNLYKSTH